MRKKVVLLHTSLVFFERERLLFDLVNEILPDIEVINIIEDKMLKEVMDNGTITPDVTRRMCYFVLAAEAMGADAIFNTCSSVGPTMDVAKQMANIPIVKIDEGMAEKASRDGKKIGVLATVPTTLKPTINLIEEKAKSVDKIINIKPFLSEGAFQLLMAGDIERHDDAVVEKAKEASKWADTIALAQCSMARLAPRISEEVGLSVLSSPKLGVEKLKQVLMEL